MLGRAGPRAGPRGAKAASRLPLVSLLGVLVAAPLVAIVSIVHDELYRKRFLPGVTDADTIREVLDGLIAKHIPEKAYPEQWDIELLKERAETVFGLAPPFEEWVKEEAVEPDRQLRGPRGRRETLPDPARR